MSNQKEKVWIAHLPLKPGYVTVAVQMIGEDKAQAGFAWCSPRDQFCRWLGRRIAEGRMAHLRTGVVLDVFPPKEGEKPHVSLFRQALGVLDETDVPTWAAERISGVLDPLAFSAQSAQHAHGASDLATTGELPRA